MPPGYRGALRRALRPRCIVPALACPAWPGCPGPCLDTTPPGPALQYTRAKFRPTWCNAPHLPCPGLPWCLASTPTPRPARVLPALVPGAHPCPVCARWAPVDGRGARRCQVGGSCPLAPLWRGLVRNVPLAWGNAPDPPNRGRQMPCIPAWTPTTKKPDSPRPQLSPSLWLASPALSRGCNSSHFAARHTVLVLSGCTGWSSPVWQVHPSFSAAPVPQGQHPAPHH